jgi:ribosomal subunit interface protein
MPLQVTGRHYNISESQEEYIDRKVGRLRRMCGKLDELKFTISRGKNTFESEGYVRSGKAVAHASAKADHSYRSIDLLVDKLEVQISKTKNKWESSKKNVPSQRHVVEESDLDEETNLPDEEVSA